jgi:hypothetical protein
MNNQLWDKLMCDHGEKKVKKITAVEGAIVLYTSQLGCTHARLPKWGDCGVRAFATVACYTLQGLATEDICDQVAVSLEMIYRETDCSDYLIDALIDAPTFDVLRQWASEVKKTY